MELCVDPCDAILKWLDAEGYAASLHTSMGWFVFTFIMFIASFTKPWAIRVVFGTLCLLFILLAAHNFAEHENTLKAAGVIGMICAPGEKWLGKISAE